MLSGGTDELASASNPPYRRRAMASTPLLLVRCASNNSIPRKGLAMGYDAHNYPVKLKLALSKVQEDSSLSAKNRDLVLRFHEACLAEGLSLARITRIMYNMRVLAKWLGKNLDIAKKGDIVKLIATLEKKCLCRVD
jgi:hypothetical protein